MRAILICPFDLTVSEVDLPDLDRVTIAQRIGVKWMDRTQLGSGVIAYVDDVGLKRKDQRFWHFVQSPTVMAGRAVLASLDANTGDTVPLDPRASLEWTANHVAFLGDADAVERNIQLGLLDRPGVTCTTFDGEGKPVVETLWRWTPDECRLGPGAEG
jgi:hypothetical protein